MSHPSPKVLVLDAMGVIYHVGDDVAELLIPFIRENGGLDDIGRIESAYIEASLGQIRAAEFWQRVGVSRAREDEYLRRLELSDGLPKMLEAVGGRFREVACLSNDVAEWSRKLRNRFGLERYISRWYISGDLGARKPSLDIYRYMLHDLNVAPDDVLFVDDRARICTLRLNWGSKPFTSIPQILATTVAIERFRNFLNLFESTMTSARSLRRNHFILVVAIALWGVMTAHGEDKGGGRMIDLTHSFDESTIYWPTEDGFKLIRESAGVTEQGYYYAANRFMCAEHGGTHIDAPVHFFEKGATVDKIALKRLIGPGACVDVSPKCANDRDYQVTVEDFEKWEKDHKATLEDRIVLIRTGYGRDWSDRAKYLGTAEHGKAAVAKLHFPGLDPAAADWLVTRRKIRMVGIDTASIDHGQTHDYPTHQRLFRNGVPALENVAAVEELPADGFSITALPMKIKGGSGAPCRIVATIER